MRRLVAWIVKDKVLLSCIEGALRVEDFPDLDANIISKMESSTASEVHILTDISLMTTMPNVIQMTKLKYISHPKIGFFVTQSRSPIEQFVGKTVGNMLKSKYKFVNDLNEGIHFLSQIDDLPPQEEMLKRVEEIRNQFVGNASTQH